MIGTPRVHLRLTDSTNERAKELAAAGAPHGTLVTADEQSAGRGRQGRIWTAPARSAVLMSLVTRRLAPTLPLAAAVAICEALPVRCEIKWPNDIWLERRKLAGILVEGRPQEGWAVLGIGLNVTTESFPPELAEIATSLRLAGDRSAPRSRCSRTCSTRWTSGSRRRTRPCWQPGASATLCAGSGCAGRAARAPLPASTRAAG